MEGDSARNVVERQLVVARDRSAATAAAESRTASAAADLWRDSDLDGRG